MSISPVTTRSWLPGQAEVAALARELHALVGLGAVADQVAQAPDLVRRRRRRRRPARPRRPAGCRARPTAGRCACGCLLQCPGNGSQGSGGQSGRARLPLAIVVAVAAAGAATFLLRPRSGLIEPAAVDAQSYFTAFQLDRAEDFRSVQRLIARGRARARHRHARAAGLAPAAARVRAARTAADPGRRGRRGGHLAAAGGGRPAAVRLEPRARRRRRPVDPGLARLARRRGQVGGDRRRLRGGRRRARAGARAALPAPLVGARRGRGGRLRRDHDLAVPGRDRPDLQRLREAAARADALRRAGAGATRPAWTWGRSTGSTRAAARRRPTPTSTGSATPSGWCCTTT